LKSKQRDGKIQDHKIMSERACYIIQIRKRAARSIARYGRRKPDTILGCPFVERGVAAVGTSLGLEVGGFAKTLGKGGSATSDTDRRGNGASAGGM
jgi:hypothetical protein